MSSVTVNGHTYTDDSDPGTGLANGGHRSRFIPLIQDVVAVAGQVATNATSAGEQAAVATTKAAEASASAVAAAAAGAGLTGTSTTSLAVGTGLKNITTQSGKSWAVGMTVTLTRTADVTQIMLGTVSSYSGTSLVVNVTDIWGAGGTFTDWSINWSAPRGATGPAGEVTLAGVQTLTNKTLTTPALTNPTLTNYTETLYAPAAGAAFTVDNANGTIHEYTTNANTTITLPAAAAGKSFTVIIKYGGAHTITWAGGTAIKWPGGIAPTATSVNGKADIYHFMCDSAATYGRDGGRNF
jgi:hypothetical protein